MDKEQIYNNPIVYQRADPYVYYHTDGYYYFTGSIPQYDCIEIRRARSINELWRADARIIWKKHTEGERMGSHIWAPEIHYIKGVWYIYFAAGGIKNVWDIRAYALKCAGDNPFEDEWVEAGEIDVGEKSDSFTLDMTVFEHRGEHYFIWAQKPFGIAKSNLYISRMKTPTELDTEPMLLTTPEYDWERQGFEVNEGPAVLIRNGKVFVTYSASDTGYRYCVGMLWADEDTDLLDKKSWHKSKKPVFKTNEEKNCFGPGHNSFTVDGDRDVFVYHSRNYKEIMGDPLYDPNRHARAIVIKYDKNGFPIFEL